MNGAWQKNLKISHKVTIESLFSRGVQSPVVGTFVMALMLSSCDFIRKSHGRETIFDRVISIPKTLVLDIPKLSPLCDEIAGLKRGFVKVENSKLYYEEEGSGIPLVMISGGPGETHHVFHPHFSNAKSFAQIIYYDQRGTGKSSTDDTGVTYTIRQAVEDLESLRLALGIEKWAVLGWSYGGFLAQCYALTYPERVIGLVLVAAGDGLRNVKMKPSRQGMFLSQAECDAIGKIWTKEHAGKLTLAQAGYNAHLAGNWKKQNYYKPTPNEFVRAALYNWTPAQGFRSFIGQDMLKISLDRQFDDFEIPTLIFEGKWDLTWDSDKIDFMRENHPHARVEVFEKSGHAIFADEPEKFFRLLKEFLETSSKKTITYKPGNRLTWPKPLSELACKVLMVTSLPDTEERAERLSEIYRQAIEENSKEADGWERLFFTFFYKKGEAKKALEALQRYEHLAKTQDPEKLKEYSHCIKVWRGQLLDLLGRRAEAIKCYQEILRDFKYVNYNCGDVDRKWLEDHIKKPFALD